MNLPQQGARVLNFNPALIFAKLISCPDAHFLYGFPALAQQDLKARSIPDSEELMLTPDCQTLHFTEHQQRKNDKVK